MTVVDAVEIAIGAVSFVVLLGILRLLNDMVRMLRFQFLGSDPPA